MIAKNALDDFNFNAGTGKIAFGERQVCHLKFTHKIKNEEAHVLWYSDNQLNSSDGYVVDIGSGWTNATLIEYNSINPTYQQGDVLSKTGTQTPLKITNNTVTIDVTEKPRIIKLN